VSGSLRATGVMIACAAFVILWFFFESGGAAYVIQVDYSWGGEFLDSAEVVVDDSVIGVLLPQSGGQRVTGFEVEPGDHRILVRTEACEGIEREVSLSHGETRRAVFMAEIAEGSRCRVRLW
jgi:hypothetical protein